MSKKTIKIQFQNGLVFQNFISDVFEINGLCTLYDFVESSDPDFIVFGPYGKNIPPKGDYIRIGYYCENMYPDLNICEWAFGVMRSEHVNANRYARIQWHGQSPLDLIKSNEIDPELILHSKSKFCNFIYSAPVPYREEFFKKLSKYKKIDSPGKAMNNMPSIDSNGNNNRWNVKKNFLTDYKFTIAFENYSHPGYQTEKLYDSMVSNSIPIYCGDPFVSDIFNTKSFINTYDHCTSTSKFLARKIEPLVQPSFRNSCVHKYKGIPDRIIRKLKKIGRNLKMNIEFSTALNSVVERVIEIDKDDSLYLNLLKQPWLVENKIPVENEAKEQWIRIFSEL